MANKVNISTDGLLVKLHDNALKQVQDEQTAIINTFFEPDYNKGQKGKTSSDAPYQIMVMGEKCSAQRG